MTTYLSSDKNMYEAYINGKDLYAMIAQSAYHNDYFDNLEFFKEFTEVDQDGKTVIAGSAKEKTVSTDETDSITVPWCYLLETPTGDVAAQDLAIGDKINSDIGLLQVVNSQYVENTEVNGSIVKNIKLTFAEAQE